MAFSLTDTEKETSVLLIDPQGTTQRTLALDTGNERFRIKVVDSVEAALQMFAQAPFDVALVAGSADRAETMETVKRIKRGCLHSEVIVLADSCDDQMAVQAMKAGAFDCIGKACSNEQLLLRLRRAGEHRKIKQELITLRQNAAMDYGFDNFVGISEPIRQLKETVGRIAPTDIPTLITGGPGSGKGLLARIIHYHSKRCDGPFVQVGCSINDGALLEATLFGPEEAAGYPQPARPSAAVQRAHGGTLFLDAVDGMPLSVQSRLLRFLQDFRPMSGSTATAERLDLRPIAASESDLSALVAEGRFRQELLYRLSVISVNIPALAKRTEDIALLGDHLLRKIAADTGKRQPTISQQALDKLTWHSWPGNVRELENTLRKALARCNDDQLGADDISLAADNCRSDVSGAMPGPSVSASAEGLLKDNQRAVISKALADNNWNFTQTAQALGIGRTTLWRKVKKYNLKREGVI